MDAHSQIAGGGSPYWFRSKLKLTPKANPTSQKAAKLREQKFPIDGPCIAPQDLFNYDFSCQPEGIIPEDVFANFTRAPQSFDASQSDQTLNQPLYPSGTYLDPASFSGNNELLGLTANFAYTPHSGDSSSHITSDNQPPPKISLDPLNPYTPPSSDGSRRVPSNQPSQITLDQIDPILRLATVHAQATSTGMKTYSGTRSHAGSSRTAKPATDEETIEHASNSQDSNSHASNNSNDGSDGDDNALTQGSGRISEAMRLAMEEAFDAVDAIFESTATKLHRTRDNIVYHWNRRHKKTQSVVTNWNMYQSFYSTRSNEKEKAAKYAMEHPEEVSRGLKGKDFDKSVSACYATFQLRNPTNWLEILEANYELEQASHTGKTLLARQRDFEKLADRLETQLVQAHRQQGFQGFFALVGNAVNEDAGLGRVFVTSGAEGVLEDVLLVSPDSLIGQLKSHVFHRQSIEFTSALKKKRELKTEHDEDSVIASGSTAAGAQAGGSGGTSFDDTLCAIRGRFVTMINSAGIPCDQLPWSSLGMLIAKKGIYLARWPEFVPFPGVGLAKAVKDKDGKKKQGIKEIGSSAARRLWAAMQDPKRAPTLVEGSKDALLSSQLPVFVEVAPSSKSKSSRGRRGFINGIVDTKGIKRATNSEDGSPLTVAAVPADPPSSPIHRTTRARDKKRKVSPASEDDSPSPPPKKQKEDLIPPIATIATRGAKRVIKSKAMIDSEDDAEDFTQAINEVLSLSDDTEYDEGVAGNATRKGKGKVGGKVGDKGKVVKQTGALAHNIKGKGKATDSPILQNTKALAAKPNKSAASNASKGAAANTGKSASIEGAAANAGKSASIEGAAANAGKSAPTGNPAGPTLPSNNVPEAPASRTPPNTATAQTASPIRAPAVKTTAVVSSPSMVPSKRRGPDGSDDPPPKRRLSSDKPALLATPTLKPRPRPRPIQTKVQGNNPDFAESRAYDIPENYGQPRPHMDHGATPLADRYEEYEEPHYSPAPGDADDYARHDCWRGYPPPNPRDRRPYLPMYEEEYGDYHLPLARRYPHPYDNRYPASGTGDYAGGYGGYPGPHGGSGYPAHGGGYPGPRGAGYPGYPIPPGSRYPPTDPRYPMSPNAWPPHRAASQAGSVPDTEGAMNEVQWRHAPQGQGQAEASGSGSAGV